MSVSPSTPDIVARREPIALYPLTHEALELDDNPRHLPVLHVTTPEPGHRCAPRVLATCCRCSEQYNLCDATLEDVAALMSLTWICGEHQS